MLVQKNPTQVYATNTMKKEFIPAKVVTKNYVNRKINITKPGWPSFDNAIENKISAVLIIKLDIQELN